MSKRVEAHRGAPLRRERELRGWSQSDVASRIGVPSPFHVSRWERGVVTPSPRYRERYCRLFGKTATELGFIAPDAGAGAGVAASRSEADERASRLRMELARREAHPDVVRCCTPELLRVDYCPVVLEATRGIADRIRLKTGLRADGDVLVEAAFVPAGAGPLLAFNTLRTEAEQIEHRAFVHLLKGLFCAFLSPTAHGPPESWPMAERDALDVLTLLSLLHRWLDTSIPAGPRPRRTQGRISAGRTSAWGAGG